MKRMYVLMMLVVMIALVGCTKVDYTTVIKCVGPNWTSDGKIEYFKVERVWKHSKNMVSEWDEIESEKSWLYEENADGSGKIEKGLVFDDVYQYLDISSSSGEWVVFDNITEIDEIHNSYANGEIWIMKRDGTGLEKVGIGLYPDLSPDGSNIVYAKKGEGIWIMNRDGSEDHQIVSDTTASYPSWSPDDTLIAYISNINIAWKWGVHIVNETGDSIGFYATMEYPKWSKTEQNVIYCTQYMQGIKINVSTSNIDTLNIRSGQGINPDPNSQLFIAYDGSWFIINRDGTNKHYIEP